MADALSSMAARLSGGDSAARDFTRLVERARDISARARQINNSKWLVIESASALTAEIVSFATEVAAAAERTRRELERNRAVAHALALHAERIARISGVEAGGSVRAELGPLEATLSALQGTMAAGTGHLADAAALATRAAGLAASALRLRDGGRDAERAVLELHVALNAFAADAGAIATSIAGAATALGQAAASMAWRTSNTLSPATAALLHRTGWNPPART